MICGKQVVLPQPLTRHATRLGDQHQPQQGGSDQSTRAPGKGRHRGLGAPCEGTPHPTTLLVGFQREAVTSTVLPHGLQGHGQQGQGIGLVSYVCDDAVDEPRLEADAGRPRRSLDGIAETVHLERTDQEVSGGDQ